MVVPPPPEPTIVALDGQGHPIPNRVVRGRIERPNISECGPCALHARGLSGLAPQWSHVASAIRPFPGKLVGRAFFSCIDTEYYFDLHGQLEEAGSLVEPRGRADISAGVAGCSARAEGARALLDVGGLDRPHRGDPDSRGQPVARGGPWTSGRTPLVISDTVSAACELPDAGDVRPTP